ncbi:hypothetical protein DXA22_10050, partial [Bifidobacterium pseudocatenulatum]
VSPPANVAAAASRANAFRLLSLEPNVPSPFRDHLQIPVPPREEGTVGRERARLEDTTRAGVKNLRYRVVSVIHLLCAHGVGRVGLDIFPEGCGYGKGTPKGPLRR